ncbi:hypothetical protein [Catenuloplanes indicus]|uniref:Secreted protein n=1 Tax=Catenuloplanes indicus TaxID=137267 RepID=A0AAE3VW16_9ACTN|nr:hypothetical protein [Catenuloplanes indicus]MDQ0364282.1 hypothetical protein [Catenuloplanes indicus]
MPIAFNELASWLDEGSLVPLTNALLAADETERRALAGQLRQHELLRRPHDVFDDALSHEERRRRWREDEVRRPYRQAALRVAGAACLPRAAAIVSWLRSARFPDPMPAGTADAIVRVLSAPGRPSAAAVARGLAGRLRPAQVDAQWPIISALLRATGQTPVPTEATVRGWLRETGLDVERLDADPWTPLMLPHVFSIPRVGGELDGSGPGALTRLCEIGGCDRAVLLADCLMRLGQGDRLGALRPFVTMHRLLAPTLDETARHATEYAGLLSSPYSTVAGIGLETLRALDDAGRLTSGAVAEAGFAALARTEKKLFRAQLAWLNATLARKPDPEVYAALVSGLASPAPDLAERALAVAVKHLPAIGEAGRELLAAAAETLDGDLCRQVNAVLGRATAPVEPVALPPVPPVAAMPAPLGSVAEVAAAAAVLVRPGREWSDPVLLELLLDGLVRFAAEDRKALASALRPVVGPRAGSAVARLVCAIVDGHWVKPGPGPFGPVAPPSAMLAERVDELGRAIPYTAPPGLLATPATVDGHVDPARVLALLESAERSGWAPRPYDLSQALLRLPRTVDASITAAAGRLTTPAGRAFADWLRKGGLPDPVVVMRQPCTHGPDCWCTPEGQRRTAEIASIPAGGLSLPAGLLEVTEERPAGVSRPGLGAWPMVLPGHREVIAAHLRPYLADTITDRRIDVGYVLPVLAQSGGPFGPATALCLAHGLTAARVSDRVAAVDAFLALAARRELDGALVGRELAALFSCGEIVLTRVVAALAETARAGAGAQVWDVACALIPAVLTVTPVVAGAADLLALAASVAPAGQATAPPPEVSAVAARGGRSRLVTEASRLRRVLRMSRR